MKKTYIKTIVREIKKSFGRFVAIFAIVTLGVGFLAGLLATTPSMKLSVDQYYDKFIMTDIFIKSATGLTHSDLEAISSIEEVDHVMAAYVTDALMETNDEVLATRIFGVPLDKLSEKNEGFVNQLELIEGRMPQADGECLVERSGSYLSEIEIGATISLSNEDENYDAASYIYNTTEYTVVGIVGNPFYFSMERESTKIGNGRVESIIYVDEGVYELDVYTDFYITALGASKLNTFSDEYEKYIDETVVKIKESGKPEWYVLDRNSNVSYVSFAANSEKIASIATVFPIFFFLVAALVALTTMTRMVEEERTQIGMLKALGYTKGAIMNKYIIYCGLASLMGSTVGLVTGFRLLPVILWRAYEFVYHLPIFVTRFSWEFALKATILAIICTMGATVSACNYALKEKPATLMLPRAPKAGKRIWLERVPFIWSHMKFSHKATARNIFRYKKHLFMTIIGIGGCTALIVTGFGLRDSLAEITKTQFGEIIKYDLLIEADESIGYDTILEEFINDTALVNSYTKVYTQAGSIKDKGKKVATNIYVPQDTTEFGEVISFRERKSGKKIVFDEASVIITEKMAESFGVKVGDEIKVQNVNGEEGIFVLTDITENYVGSYIYINKLDYVNVYGEEPAFHTLLLKTLITDETQQDIKLTELLMSEVVSNAEFITLTKKTYDNLLTSISFIVIVLIMAAGALAIIVLYNLTNININERRKELATLKVLGFYNNEVAGYIFREILILSIIGTLVGLVLGVGFHAYVIRMTENVDFMFGRKISLLSFVLSAVITILFSLIVEWIMYKKLKKIEMVESMKVID